MYRVFYPAIFVGQPRTSAPRVGAGFGVALATLLGCGEFDRPTFPGGTGFDSIPPDIQITAPQPADTIVTGGASVNFSVTVRDPSTVKDVQVSVTGAVAFSVPDMVPNDTMTSMILPVPTSKTKAGRAVLSISATDAFDNAVTKTFAFVVK